MIKNIIFDFGDIFINLDKKEFARRMQDLKIEAKSDVVHKTLEDYEKGLISTENFTTFFNNHLGISPEKIIEFWNSILLDFPAHRLTFLQELAASKKYRLFLLSNTNDLHISWIKNDLEDAFFNSFKTCFEQFYLSHEIHFKKPDLNCFEFVLKENNLEASETLFVDDLKENTQAANRLGIHTWNLIPGKEDVTELFAKNKNLF